MAATLPKAAPFRREHTGDAAMDRVQRAAQVVTKAHEQTKAYITAQAAIVASSLAPAGGQLLSNVTIDNGGITALAHSLGRVPTGYVLTRVRTSAAAFSVIDNAAATKTTLSLLLQSTLAGLQSITADVYIF